MIAGITGNMLTEEKEYWLRGNVIKHVQNNANPLHILSKNNIFIALSGKKCCTGVKEEITCVFDGTISHRKQLYKQIEGINGEMNSAEAIARIYQAWGEDIFKRVHIEGQCVIWNSKTEALLIWGDKLGLYPIYYTETNGNLLFSTDTNMLINAFGVSPLLDCSSIAELIGLYPLHTCDFGIFKNVSKLLPGHFGKWNHSTYTLRRYWTKEYTRHTDNLPITAERLRSLIKDGVTGQIDYDGSTAALLSGGLCSSAVTSIAAGSLAYMKGERLRTYSYYLERGDIHKCNPDLQWIERVRKELHTKHTNLYLDLSNSTNADENIYTLPHLSFSDRIMRNIYKQIAPDASTLLCGEGGDECFGGDLNHNISWRHNLSQRESVLTKELSFYVNIGAYMEKKFAQEMERIAKTGAQSKQQIVETLLFNWYTAYGLMHKRQLAQSNGVELKTPLVNHGIINYLCNISAPMKNLGGSEKGLLRFAMKGVLPDDVLARKRTTPQTLYSNIAEENLRQQLEQLLTNPNAPILQIIDPKAVTIIAPLIPFTCQPLPLCEWYAYLIELNEWMLKNRVQIG